MDISKEIYSHCSNPRQLEVLNPITREKELREIPCGHCYHCRMTKINEWVTRMVLESQYRKHTYFVTLTYDSATTATDVLQETYPVWHNINQRKKYDFQPLVLNKTHLQKFVKRLRKQLGFPIKYYGVGEYGHKYGRPHYHLILWSDEPITAKNIQDSWILYGQKIGNIDFNDLVLNGTMSSTDSFKYVCKYLHKQSYNIFNSPTKDYHYELLDRLYAENSASLCDAKIAYRRRFNPFTLCSKQPAVGFDYFNANFSRFAQRNFTLPNFKDTELIFPAYYLRKTKELLSDVKSISPTNGKPNTFVGVFDVYSYLVSLLCSKDYITRDSKVSIDFRCPSKVSYDSSESRNVAGDFYIPSVRETFQYQRGLQVFAVFKRREFIRYETIEQVLSRLETSWEKICNMLKPMHAQRRLLEKSRREQIAAHYGVTDIGDIEQYEKMMSDYKHDLLNHIDYHEKLVSSRQSLYYQTKNIF